MGVPITIREKAFRYTTKIMETEDGPERQLTLWPEGGTPEADGVTVQECGGIGFCLNLAYEAMGADNDEM